MKNSDRIEISPERCYGKVCIKGTRLSVDFILELLSSDWSYQEIQDEYDITKEDILTVLGYAKDVISSEKVYRIHT